MGFKKVTKSDIMYEMYENLIGMPQNLRKEEVEQALKAKNAHHIQESSRGIFLPIIFQRNEDYSLNTEGDLVEFQREDTIAIRNQSQSDKIWNIRIQFDEQNKDFLINELLPNEEWSHTISQETEINECPLQIFENISKKDFHIGKKIKPDLFLEKTGENILFFTLHVNNISQFPINDLHINKMLPSTKCEIIESSVSDGELIASNKRITWNIKKLEPRKGSVLKYKLRLEPRSVSTGQTQAQFRVDVADPLYSLKKLDSSLKVVQFIHINEQDEHPGNWDCSLTIINRSEYEINVKKVNLIQIDAEKQIELYSSDLLIPLAPLEEKTLFNTLIKSKDRPVLKKHVVFDIKNEITNDYTANLILEENQLEVLNIVAKKRFSVTSIKSFESSPFTAKIEIENFSSLPINHVFISEILPKEFGVGNLGEIKIIRNEKSITFAEINNNILSSLESFDIVKIKHAIEEINSHLQENLDKVSQNEEKILDFKNQLQNYAQSSSDKDIELVLSEIKKLEQQNKHKLDEIAEYQKSIQRNNEEIKKIEVKIGEFDKIKNSINEKQKYEEESNKSYKQLDHVQNQLNNLKIELNSILESIKSNTDPEKVNKLKKKQEDAEKKQKTLEEELKTINNTINGIKKSISEQDKGIPKGESLESIKNSVSALFEAKNKLETSNLEINKKIDTINREREPLNLEIEQKNENSKQIQAQVEKQRQINAEIDGLLKLNTEIQKSTADLTIAKQNNINQLSKAELTQKADVNVNSLLEMFIQEFQERIDKDETEAKVQFLDNHSNGNILLISLNNLKELISEINPENSLIIDYPIKSIRPRNDIDYEFPTTIHYDTLPAKNLQKYEISAQFLPKIEIMHERQKISLGKIVDTYNDKGRYHITLLLRNNGQKAIEALTLLDTLPRNATISNSYFEFQEHEISKEKKEVAWQIKKIGAYEEIEVSYMVDLGENIVDLNDYEVIFK